MDSELVAWLPLLQAGDTVIDGGNSYYRDDMRRGVALRARGMQYLDVGTSGGIWGTERGYCLMTGGEAEVVQRLHPLFAALSPGLEAAVRTLAVTARPAKPLRAERRRALCEDGPQRHRVRVDGRVRRGL